MAFILLVDSASDALWVSIGTVMDVAPPQGPARTDTYGIVINTPAFTSTDAT